jgi:RNA polymerase sigma factor (sigma-70 family)
VAHEIALALRTTTKLLDDLRSPGNEPAWVHIDHRYRPVIAGLALRLGLSQPDAEEVAQQTLAEFVRAYREGRYDRAKGRLSSWILGIAHHTALRLMRESRGEVHPGATALAATPDPSESPDALRRIWADERDRSIVSRAMTLLREDSDTDDRTLLAFELVAMRGVPAAEAAAQCEMSVEQVYVVKSRITKRLRAIVQDLTDAFERDD